MRVQPQPSTANPNPNPLPPIHIPLPPQALRVRRYVSTVYDNAPPIRMILQLHKPPGQPVPARTAMPMAILPTT